MLKKFIAGFLLAAACTLPVLTTEATNWIKVGENYNSTLHYIDTDSFSYNKADNIAKCWVKVYKPADNSYMLAYEYFNFNERMMGIKSTVIYENGTKLGEETNAYVEYNNPIIPESALEKYASILETFVFLQESSLLWEFNKLSLPEFSPIGSSNWVPFNSENDNKEDLIDRNSMYTSNGNIDQAWFLSETNDAYCLRYDLWDKESKRKATAKQVFLRKKDMLKVFEVNYPVLVWFDPQNVSEAERTVIDKLFYLSAQQ